MRFEIPECRRCCLCVPLRHGILIFGYLNFFFSTFLLGFNIWLFTHRAHIPMMYRGVQMDTQLWFCYLLCVLEIVFNFVLLVGAHRKNSRLLRVYYFYGIVSTLASFLVYLVLVRKMPFDTDQAAIFYPIEFCLAFSGLLIQCYLLLVIRSELNKLKYQGGPFRYNNHIAEVDLQPGAGREPQCFSIFYLGLFVWLSVCRPRAVHSSILYRGVEMHTQIWFGYLMWIMEVVFNVVLLVGAHKKNSRVIRLYYYFGIVTTLASFLTYLVLVRKMPFDLSQSTIFYPIEFCLALAGLSIQCYLLLVIRSELKKLKFLEGPFRYDNRIAEVFSTTEAGREGCCV